MKNNLNILAVCLIASILFFVGCVEEETTVSTEIPTITASPPSITPEPTLMATLEEEPNTTVLVTPTVASKITMDNLEVGDQATVDDIAVIVTKVLRVEEINLPSGGTQTVAQDGNVFVLVNIQVTNFGDDIIQSRLVKFEYIDSDGRRIGRSYYLGDDDFPMNEDILPDKTMSGVVLFEIPEDEDQIKIRYYYDDIDNASTATWNCNI